MQYDPMLLIFVCVFGAVALVAYFVTSLWVSRDDELLRRRLVGDVPMETRRAANVGLVPLLQKVSDAAAEPFMPKTREKQSALRKQMASAGIYAPGAIRLITGLKVILLVGGLFCGYAVGTITEDLVLSVAVGGLIGYALPVLWLRRQVRHNRDELTAGLPDALDLMVVCVEAGLTIDAAIQRVGQELSIAHPRLSRELGIAHMETRVGLSRSEALRNLGTRTSTPGIQSLVAMLIQADRFGTSIGSALRVHADALRQKRQFEAEEQAAKASVKLTFPLVLFIFPSTFIVLGGPAIIQMMKSSFFE